MAEADAEKDVGGSVGEYLKGVRLAKGLELDEASRITKIGRNYLMAIEAGQFDRLPSAAYIKGFLRLYAAYLSLSGDDVVARYERSRPQSAGPQVTPPPERPKVEVVDRRLSGRSRWLIPGVLLVLVIIAAVFLSPEDQRPVRQAAVPAAPAAPATVQPAPAPVPAPAKAVLPPRSSATAQPAPAETPSVMPPVEQKPGGVVLRLHFNRDSWLSITIDDSISQRYDLKAGDIIEWKGSKAFVLDVGDGGAVEGQFNGRPLKALGEAGKPAHVELKGS